MRSAGIRIYCDCTALVGASRRRDIYCALCPREIGGATVLADLLAAFCTDARNRN